MTKIVHVRLMDEAVEVARPTLAIEVTPMTYKLLPTDDYNPEFEEWEFLPGSVVKCEKRVSDGEEYLLAVSKVEG
jgi:hypothetical protein